MIAERDIQRQRVMVKCQKGGGEIIQERKGDSKKGEKECVYERVMERERERLCL